MTNKKYEIGKPPESWPMLAVLFGTKVTTETSRQEIAKREFQEAWRQLFGDATADSYQVASVELSRGSKAVVKKILQLDSVRAWVEQGNDQEARDSRAARVAMAVYGFDANARKDWRTPQERAKHYKNLAGQLRVIQRMLLADPVPALRRGAESLGQLAAVAAKFEGFFTNATKGRSTEDKKFLRLWSLPRPHHADTASNEFVRALHPWLEAAGCARRRLIKMTTDITNVVFPDADIGERKVRSLLRNDPFPAKIDSRKGLKLIRKV